MTFRDFVGIVNSLLSWIFFFTAPHFALGWRRGEGGKGESAEPERLSPVNFWVSVLGGKIRKWE